MLEQLVGCDVSLRELERLVADAEADPALRRALRQCRTRGALILMARRLGYRISRLDLQKAQAEDMQERLVMAASG
jgi:predicted ribosomally synthesized peptide with nif11-like leader